jgi:predicted enzyme related to lactoylglutathione lyase
MIRSLASAAAAFTLVASAHAQTPTGTHMPAPIVFFDIAGPDLPTQQKFYGAVFDWTIAPDGRFNAPVTVGPGLPAFLRTDPKETVVYMGVDDINATLAKVVANGGKVHAPRMVVPGVVILGLFFDPAGNRVGLVEMKDGKPIVP